MKLKKIAALVLALLVLLSFTGCLGNFYENAGTVNGTEISAGLYLMAQYDAYSEARSNEAIDTEQDIFKQTLDGKSMSDWISSRTEEALRRYVAVRALSREKDVQLDATAQENLQQMTQYWPALEEMYSANGVAYPSFERFYVTEELGRILFLKLYGEGGELEAPDEEIQKEYTEEYAHIRTYSVPLNALEGGTELRDETLAMVAAIADKLNAGGLTLEEAVQQELPAVFDFTGRTFDASTAPTSIASSYLAYQPDSYGTYSETFLNDLKAQSVGDFGYYDMTSTAILYEKVEMFADEEEYEAEKPMALQRLRTDDYEEYLRGIYSEYTVEWLPFVRTYFRPTKIKSSAGGL